MEFNFANWSFANPHNKVLSSNSTLSDRVQSVLVYLKPQLTLILGFYRACFASIVISDHNRHGLVQIPSFVQEPPSHVTFSNNTGTQLVCVAHGNPIPLITWLTKDGSIVNTVPGLRFVHQTFFLSLKRNNIFRMLKGFGNLNSDSSFSKAVECVNVLLSHKLGLLAKQFWH